MPGKRAGEKRLPPVPMSNGHERELEKERGVKGSSTSSSYVLFHSQSLSIARPKVFPYAPSTTRGGVRTRREQTRGRPKSFCRTRDRITLEPADSTARHYPLGPIRHSPFPQADPTLPTLPSVSHSHHTPIRAARPLDRLQALPSRAALIPHRPYAAKRSYSAPNSVCHQCPRRRPFGPPTRHRLDCGMFKRASLGGEVASRRLHRCIERCSRRNALHRLWGVWPKV